MYYHDFLQVGADGLRLKKYLYIMKIVDFSNHIYIFKVL